jgi:hypothetical protein
VGLQASGRHALGCDGQRDGVDGKGDGVDGKGTTTASDDREPGQGPGNDRREAQGRLSVRMRNEAEKGSDSP